MQSSLYICLMLSTAIATPAHAAGICGASEEFDFSRIEILPFGGEIIGVTTSVGEIINTNVDVQFTATGAFDAADIAVAFEIFDASGGVGVGFSGSQLGWSGQGTFAHQFDTSALNGLLYPGQQPFSTFIVTMTNLDPGSGPITGNFDRLVYTIQYGACPPGDVDHDLNVDINDLLMVINAWGPCPAPPAICDADTDGDGVVEIDDLLTVINHWGPFCPKCS